MNRLILIAFLFFGESTFAQEWNLSIKQIDSIVNSIDTSRDMKFQEDGHTFIDRRNGTMESNSDDYFLEIVADSLREVIYRFSIDNTDSVTYYFYKWDLILVSINKWNNLRTNHGTKISGRFYFWKDLLIQKIADDKLTYTPELLLLNSRKYLTEFRGDSHSYPPSKIFHTLNAYNLHDDKTFPR